MICPDYMGFPHAGVAYHGCVCVCVSHTLFQRAFSFMLYLQTSRGQWPIHESIANEATHELGGHHD